MLKKYVDFIQNMSYNEDAKREKAPGAGSALYLRGTLKNDWRRVRCTAKAKFSTPTARHSLSESSAEQNIRNFSVLGAFRQADLNAER
mgnify:FL=1